MVSTAKVYGDVFSFIIFNQKLIVHNSPSIMKEVIERRSSSSSNRPKSIVSDLMVPSSTHLGLHRKCKQLSSGHFVMLLLEYFSFSKIYDVFEAKTIYSLPKLNLAKVLRLFEGPCEHANNGSSGISSMFSQPKALHFPYKLLLATSTNSFTMLCDYIRPSTQKFLAPQTG